MRFLLPVLLAACSAEPDQPGQVTAEEARELTEAAEMLDANSIGLNAVEDDGNEEDAQ